MAVATTQRSEQNQSEPKQPQRSRDWSWPYWPFVPLYPYSQRRTLCREIIKGKIWTFEQLQGILYVIIPVRMTVIKLAAGGLLVYAPVAPTRECIRLVKDLIEKHGEIKYIILPTASGIEHKVFTGPFSKRFPQAQVFVSPSQWTFPLNIPLSWLGLSRRQTQELPANSADTPFADEFDYAILGPVDLGLGPFEEVALFHKQSKTLLVTDSIVSIPVNPPQVLQFAPYPMLFHAKDNAFDVVEDTPTVRRKGWQRMALFAFYFQPSVLDVVNTKQTFKDARKAPDRSKKAYFGLFPVQWNPDWKGAFDAFRQDGNPIVAPILRKLIFNRNPEVVLQWADRVAQWNFRRIIPCHLDAPVMTTPQKFSQAFDFLRPLPPPKRGWFAKKQPISVSFPKEDMAFLDRVDRFLCDRNITPPAKPLPRETSEQ